MNVKQLYQAIGMIDDALIMQAELVSRRNIRRRKIRTVAAVAAVILLLCASAFAASRVLLQREGHMYARPIYTSVPAGEQMQRDVGFQAKLVNTFSNGYSFQAGYRSESRDTDMDGNLIDAYSSLYFTYQRGQDSISLTADPIRAAESYELSEPVGFYKNSNIYYYSYMNKQVPANYHMSAQDRVDEATGKYVFSYGSNTVQVSYVQLVSWQADDVHYTLVAIDSPLSQTDLIDMAEELLDAERKASFAG